MSNINYWEKLTEKQIGMLDGLRHIYPNLPVHFYSYSFIVCTPLSTCFSKVLVYLVFKISVKTIRILNSIKIKSLR